MRMSKVFFVLNVAQHSRPTLHWLITEKEFTCKSNSIDVTIAKRTSFQKRTTQNTFVHIREKSLINVKWVVNTNYIEQFIGRSSYSLIADCKAKMRDMIASLLMSLVTHRFRCVEFWISFSTGRRSWKTNIQNSTRPNRWATKDISLKKSQRSPWRSPN